MATVVSRAATHVCNPISIPVNPTLFRLVCLGGLVLGMQQMPLRGQEPSHPGAAIYQKLCVECHGEKGEGVPDLADEPLRGRKSIEALTKRIIRTMPEDKPELCVGEDAAQVAAYIYEAFYSPEAQARITPPEMDVARVTVPQFRTMVADLIGRLRPGYDRPLSEERGLKARYSGLVPEPPPAEGQPAPKKEEKDREKVNTERVDARVEFSFGSDSPEPGKMDPEEFRVRWNGSVIAEETGTYEFIVKSENGVRLWLNDNEKLLIDAWVSAGAEPREEKKSVFLLGGRAYPIALEFFKYKDKSASVQLQWKPPHGVQEVIPQRSLTPQQVPPTFVAGTSFPADDRSMGYERGTGVSKAWYQAVVEAAIAAAGYVEEKLPELSGAKPDAPDRVERLREFSEKFTQAAFRRPLNDGQKQFIAAQFEEAKTPELAVKRVVLFALESPNFLYPEVVPAGQADAYDVASRLALNLWDSLPDEALLKAAAEGKLSTREGVAEQIRRMLPNPRTKAKLHGFFHHWLELERADMMAKNAEAFPDFQEAVVADLRRSLSLFLDEIVWSERSDYRDLLRADYLLLNGRLAKFLGKDVEGDAFQKVSFDPKERAGLITHPYLLSVNAYEKNSSPIHRGVFLTRKILGMTLKSPPMANVFKDSHFDPSFTMREKVAEMTKDTSCMGCHVVINPLGFALENYDAVGRWRTEDNHKPVDPVSVLATDEGDNVKLTGARDVAEFAAGSESGHRAFIRQLFHHMVKQSVEPFGGGTLDHLEQAFASSEFHVQKLLAEIALVSASHALPAPEPKLAQQAPPSAP
ncbi:MAG: DUF1592 domain-containing protein [Chthoniobacteraceae bacterium]